MTDIDATIVTAAADLGRADAERTPQPYGLDTESTLLVTRLRNDERIEVQSLEKHLADPRAPRGLAVLHNPDHWVTYVNRLLDEDRTTVWADVDAGRLTAVLDDHQDAYSGGWREHRVRLDLRIDADWSHWAAQDGKLLTQAAFAEHLEAATHTIVAPDAATMYEIATSFRATRNAQFASDTRLDNGDIQLSYLEETDAKAGKRGDIEIPRTFTLRLAPWVGAEPVEVTARLRYDITNGRLVLGYSLHRPDLIKRDVFADLVERLSEPLETAAIFSGAVPDSLR